MSALQNKCDYCDSPSTNVRYVDGDTIVYQTCHRHFGLLYIIQQSLVKKYLTERPDGPFDLYYVSKWYYEQNRSLHL